jgi:iron complex outermembrane receptor protein
MKRFRLTCCAAAACACAAAPWPAFAQATSQTVVVTGNPLGRDRGAAPASVLAGDALLARRSATLGETLDGLPGVANTAFGPNAGRPVIRGLDGDRIRVLDNGGASIDASSLSFDHAAAVDPLVAERIEVLRGPAALLYGGSATGGVVNTLDNRIPRAVAPGPLSGRAELRLGGAANERAGGFVLEGGTGSGLAWHADAYRRRTDDLRTPLFTPVEDGEPLDPARRVRNSAASAEGGALGAAFVGRNGFAGVSVDGHRNDYGVTAEADVTIRMKRDRVNAAGEWRGGDRLGTWSAQVSRTDYRHQEVEGSGEVGTTFDSQGRDGRLTWRHPALGALQGVIGVQAESLDFSALGEEAFVPGTRTRSSAVFALETFDTGTAWLTGGARAERVRVRALPGEEERFAEARERRFTPVSAALEAGARLGGGWNLHAGLSRTERAPAYYELYADGLHIATGAYERGDRALPLERSHHLEVGVAFKTETASASFNLFQTRFSRFIALDATGNEVDGEPEYAFAAVRARLEGFEADWRQRVSPAWELQAGADLVRARNLTTGEPLPRQPPLRLRAGVSWQFAPAAQLTLAVRHAAKQSRVPDTDTATGSWTRVDLTASGALPALARGASWYVSAKNLGDTLAFDSTAIQGIRGLSPQAGRALSGGVQLRF